MMRPEKAAAWATGIGIGVATFTTAWFLLNRLLALWMPVPAAPVAALGTAILLGVVLSVERGRALARRVEQTEG
jgi:apolipoprotein N-acyltransferase